MRNIADPTAACRAFRIRGGNGGSFGQPWRRIPGHEQPRGTVLDVVYMDVPWMNCRLMNISNVVLNFQHLNFRDGREQP